MAGVSRFGLLLLSLTTLFSLLRPGHVHASVALLYFRAESSAQTIRLVWATGFELDNLGFYIYRSTDNNQRGAQPISQLIPGSNSINGSTYEFIDTEVTGAAVYYYWLESIDLQEGSHFNGPIPGAIIDSALLATATPAGPTPTASTIDTTPSPTPAVPPATPTATSTPLATATAAGRTTSTPTSPPTAASDHPLASPTPEITAVTVQSAATESPASSTVIPAAATIPARTAEGELETAVTSIAEQPSRDDTLHASDVQSVGVHEDESLLATDASGSTVVEGTPSRPEQRPPGDVLLLVLLGAGVLSLTGGALTWFLLWKRRA